MRFPVNYVTITSIAREVDLDNLIQYWYYFSGSHLKFEDHFARSSINRQENNIKIVVQSDFYFSLYTFDDLAKKFDHLTFKLVAEVYCSIDKHILVYQNGIKTIHINKYLQSERTSQNLEKQTMYISDHINRVLRIKKEIIMHNDDYYHKTYHIYYDRFIDNYIDR